MAPTLERLRLSVTPPAIGAFLVALCFITLGCSSQEPVAGDGWRLLYADERPTVAGGWGPWQSGSGVLVATNDGEWDALWSSLPVDGARPEVDFTNEIVAVFGHDRGRDCAVRLQGVEFRRTERIVFTRVVTHSGAGGACSLMPGFPALHGVALWRAALPDSPFILRADTDRCAQPEDPASVPNCGPVLSVDLAR